MSTYKCLWIEETETGFKRSITERPLAELDTHEVLIKVHYAALNYKDALSASGHKGISRNYPHTPGVDASGVVVKSKNTFFVPGDEVIVTSYDLGMNTKGAFAEYISVPASWIVPKPLNFSLKEAMILGTAAFTAGLALHKLEQNGLHAAAGKVLVTGASGGVGSLAIAVLNKAGYEVIASSGKTAEYDYLKQLGASEIVSREDILLPNEKLIAKGRWAAAIDTVGGKTLESVLKATDKDGSVAICGLVGSHELHTTVYPFILKGLNLLGIESAECAMPLRKSIWNKLANRWKPDNLDFICEEIALQALPEKIDAILQGKTRGRIVVNLKA
ncbi:MAG: YhdH/YhfP family quinone oxidoreductase [Luteibaculaceae bacterium]